MPYGSTTMVDPLNQLTARMNAAVDRAREDRRRRDDQRQRAIDMASSASDSACAMHRMKHHL